MTVFDEPSRLLFWADEADEETDDMYNALTTVFEVDDFVSGSVTTGSVGKLGWTLGSGAALYIPSEANHPGILRRTSGAAANTINYFKPSPNGNYNTLQVAAWEMTWIFRQVAPDAVTGLRIGLINQDDTITPSSTVCLEKLPADTTWFFGINNANNNARVDTGIPITSNWTKLRLRRLSGTELGLTIDANAELVSALAQPTVAMSACVQQWTTTAVAKVIEIDLYALKISDLVR